MTDLRPPNTPIPPSEAPTPTPVPKPPVAQPGPITRLTRWGENELAEIEELAERIAAKVHAKIAPVIAAIRSAGPVVADVAELAAGPSVAGVVKTAEAAAKVVASSCIADGHTVCPMHGAIHETS